MKIEIKKIPKVISSTNKIITNATEEDVWKYLKNRDVQILESFDDKPRIGKNTVFFVDLLYVIGGIETWINNIAEEYTNYNITVCYVVADQFQLLRLARNINIVKWRKGLNLECDTLIYCNYILPLRKHGIKYKKSYLTVHGDFRKLNCDGMLTEMFTKVDGIICVSNSARDGLKEVFGFDGAVIYNFVRKEIPINRLDNTLRLITLSRATQEKGISRILQMAEELKRKRVKFIWLLCGSIDAQLDGATLSKLKAMEEIIILPPSLSHTELIKFCDYTVQLSDGESYCYALHESLEKYGVPVITTNYPEAYEFIIDGENGYILNMNLSNLDVDKIYNHIPKVKKLLIKDDKYKWKHLFEEGELLK